MEFRPYDTLLKEGEDELVIKKSRFIAAACPVETEQEALAYLARRRELHPGANHTCFAYILGPNMGVMRYSDDGEPGGTAGMPIIETLKARGVTNCVAAVTRYFGGILLGAGGLTRAYASAAAAAVNAAGTGTVWPTKTLLLDVPYPLLSRVEYFLAHRDDCITQEKSFTDSVTFTLLVKSRDEDAFCAAVRDLTSGSCEPLTVSEEYRPWQPQPASSFQHLSQ